MKAISRRRSSAPEGCVFFVVSIIFLVVGSGVFYFLSALPLLNWYQAQQWESVPCTIISSSVGVHSDSDGSTYSVDIEYTYTWANNSYQSDRYNFFSGSSSGRGGKEAIVAQFPAGSEQTCFVNPDAPDMAVLNRDFSFTYIIGGFGLIFVIVALAMLRYSVRGKKNTSLSANARIQPGTAWNESRPEETVTLKADSNNVVGCGYLLLCGRICNGVFIATLSGMLRESSPPIRSLLFMIPFVLVGIGVTVGVVYFFLGMFNPRPELTLTPGTVPLGGTAELSWFFQGNTARISKLTITLRGDEKATYRRGTSTSTDTSIFEKVVLVETTAPVEIREGRVQFTIPEFTAPSFDAPNNKIVWQVAVHGDIRRWPDVSRDFPVTVVPLPPTSPIEHVPAEFREA